MTKPQTPPAAADTAREVRLSRVGEDAWTLRVGEQSIVGLGRGEIVEIAYLAGAERAAIAARGLGAAEAQRPLVLEHEQ